MLKLIRLFSGEAERVGDGEYRSFFNTSVLTNVRSIALKTCVFQNNHPNVFADDENPNDSRNNNVFSYSLGFIPQTEEISITGFYSITELLTEINAGLAITYALANPGGTCVLSLDPVTGKILVTITGTVIEPFTLQGETAGVYSLNATLGNFTDTIYNSTAKFDSLPNLTGLKYATVSIRSKSPQTILNASATKERHVNSIGAIPITVPYGALQNFSNPSPSDSTLTFSYVEDFREMIWILRDEFGRRVKNQNLSFGVEILVSTHS